MSKTKDTKNSVPSDSSYPYEGELFPSSDKKFNELIFFVPFFDGEKPQMKRHIEWVNELGYDAFVFELWNFRQSPLRSFITSKGELGLRKIIADQIEQLLNQFPQQKILYSFSNPSAAALDAAARRKCSDIKAMVCDSGPSAHLLKSTIRLYKQEYFPNHKILATATSMFLATLWNPQKHHDLKPILDQFPQDFPLLSIRGWKDSLISPKDIDEVFESSTKLDWQKLSLTEAGHLNGLRDFAQEYIPVTKEFLKKHSTEFAK